MDGVKPRQRHSRRLDAGKSLLPKAEAPLFMPAQDLAHWAPGKAISGWNTARDVVLARLFVFSATLILTALGTHEIYQVISVGSTSWLQFVFAGLFAVTFAWIAFSCASSILGFWRMMTGKRTTPPVPTSGPMGRTALLMPIYNEDPARVYDTLERMAHELVEQGAGKCFDIFVLSDTRDAAAGKREEVFAQQMLRFFAGQIHFYYRRRRENKHRKAGNIADFVERFGGAYDQMIILDADSYMASDVMIGLARMMQADPTAGIIQTLPLLMNRVTLFARLQQFASRVYGPVITHGLTAWHGRDGNYWGHNAIIRVKAFAQAAGLPELEGRKPFGGHILSHDFIEAALMRRAGWGVYMLPDLVGSYEECPPSLIDLAGRDRRWCQGNLQHMKIVGAKGLHWVSRVHLIQGIMSYLASPLWLIFMLTGLGLSAQAQYIRPEYFPDGFGLFPKWPVFDPERALQLFGLTMIVLFLPKILGVVAAMRDPLIRRGCGGARGLVKSLLAEILASSLLSPVMMMIQSRFVVFVLLGRDSGWASQNRGDEALPLDDVAKRHWNHMIEGFMLGSVALVVSWQTFLWLLPIAAGLMLAIPVSWGSGQAIAGLWARRNKLFLIPEETVAVPVDGPRPHSAQELTDLAEPAP